ncbi:MAG: phosphoheptose isomerase [Gammaproteobacteria bacterium]|nr:phosphoheptose isomerase [Gammaproteobacteria bacterium]
MSLIDRIQENFAESVEAQRRSAEVLPLAIEAAAVLMAHSIKNGGKILCCGNGGSACDAMHFASELVNRYQMERAALPAISLTADTAVISSIANDYDYTEVFAKQIRAIGKVDDVLLAISTSGNSKNIVQAIAAAKSQKMRVVSLSGRDGGMVHTILDNERDVEICVPAAVTPRIQEVHILVIHYLCDLIDYQLFPDKR